MRAVLVLGVLILLASPAWARTWTDATGSFTIEADLVSVESDVVVLLRHSDNKQIRIPLAKLSKADQDFVKNPIGPAPKEEKPIAGDGAPTPPKKLLTKEEIQAAEAAVIDLFKDDIAKARTSEQRVALADRLLTTAKAEQEGANRYVLFEKAAEIAAIAGNTKLTSECLDSLGEIQFSPVLWVDDLGTLASKKPEDVGDVFDKVDALVQKCFDADDYESANKLVGLLPTFARIAKSLDLQKRAKAKVAEVSSAGNEFKTHVVAARGVLEKNPTDADANLVVGKFLCFVKLDWDRGLPMLALGSDAALKSLAALERREPHTPADMVSLGDQWKAAGHKERAVFWYRQALPTVSGIVRVRLEKEIAATKTLFSAGRTSDLLARIDPNKDAVAGSWAKQNGTMFCKAEGCDRIAVAIRSSENYELAVDFSTSAEDAALFIFPVGNKQISWIIGGWGGEHGGLALLDGVNADGNSTDMPFHLKPHQKYSLLITVAVQDGLANIVCKIDGKDFVKWNGKVESLSISSDWTIPEGKVGFGFKYSAGVIYKANVVTTAKAIR